MKLPLHWRRAAEIADPHRRFAAALWHFHGNAHPSECYDLVGPPPDPSLLFDVDDPKTFVDTWFPGDWNAWLVSRLWANPIARNTLNMPMTVFCYWGLCANIARNPSYRYLYCAEFLTFVGYLCVFAYNRSTIVRLRMAFIPFVFDGSLPTNPSPLFSLVTDLHPQFLYHEAIRDAIDRANIENGDWPQITGFQ